MPRRQFIADLEQAAVPGALGSTASNVKRGEDDGTFTFVFTPTAGFNPVEITVMIPELADYPLTHEVITYVGDGAPAHVGNIVAELELHRKSIADVVAAVSNALQGAFSPSGSKLPTIEPDFDELEDEDDDDASATGWSDDETPLDVGGDSQLADDTALSKAKRRELLRLLRYDLRQAKSAGFRIGVMGDAKHGVDLFISLGIRISRLELSNEAMTAWRLDGTKYLIVLIQYNGCYKDYGHLTSDGNGYHAQKSIKLCVGTAANYKPTAYEARAAFTQTSMQGTHVIGGQHGLEPTDGQNARTRSFEGIFISGPLNELLNTRLVQLLAYRAKFGCGWDGAELYYNNYQGRNLTSNGDILGDQYYEVHQPKYALAPIAAADALSTHHATGTTPSFPLLAIQYTLRHLVRCTEFCLVCHNKVSGDFEALKPYVCSSPLCLYQYMSLGFGPSIEYEIASQPTVVDLLISFCYAAAKAGKLEQFPDGLNLRVPSPNSTVYKTRYHRYKSELNFDRADPKPPFVIGDWIVISVDGFSQDLWHCKVIETEYYPTIKLSMPIGARLGETSSTTTLANQQNTVITPNTSTTTLESALVPGMQDTINISFRIYDSHFDEFKPQDKQASLAALMDTLPAVGVMREWLQRNTQVGQEASLKRFEKVSPPALGVLRWIIASNRSCIIPVDPEDSDVPTGKPGTEQRVWGVGEMLQFRFAMGAPDKEQRFVTALQDAQRRLKQKHPSLFAFHGSPLMNWHSIIREGLHFKTTANGRAFGHGCYHSLQLQTSLGYSMIYAGYGNSSTAINQWPQSTLKISGAISLNEIVNAPMEFVSHNPHLVVAQLDWIQTRYLFVQSSVIKESDAANPIQAATAQQPQMDRQKPDPFHPQDPAYTPVGMSGKQLIIPASATRTSLKGSTLARVGAAFDNFLQGPNKKQKLSKRGTVSRPVFLDDEDGDTIMMDADRVSLDDDNCSVATEVEDLVFLLSEDESEPTSPTIDPKSKKTSKKPERPDAFIPGSLDVSQITFMPPPSYASPMATKRLQSDLQSLIKLQETQALDELGFYIDPELVENVYQWIVELHSFPEHLPLVKDMQSKSPPIRSIVLELRFGAQYPMSPPFVRVISPRFLGFAQGGGGHVTVGGALCMELLTNSGWSAVSSVESVLMQVRMAITEEAPAARLEKGPIRQYGIGEAKNAYLRACLVHGWTVPDDFKDIIG